MTDFEQTEDEFLEGYDLRDYPPVGVTTDIVAFGLLNGKLSVLLVQRNEHPYKSVWALPGGFVEPGETLKEGAFRELTEETGTQGWLEQLGTYGNPYRDPRGRIISIAYVSFIPNPVQPQAGSDAAAARWWPIEDLAIQENNWEGLTLAFDHSVIITDGIERARSKLEYTTLATKLLEDEFTIADLRRVYETVWGVTLNQGNFWAKVRKIEGFVEATGEKETPSGRGAPGDLYKAGDREEVLFPPIRRQGTE